MLVRSQHELDMAIADGQTHVEARNAGMLLLDAETCRVQAHGMTLLVLTGRAFGSAHDGAEIHCHDQSRACVQDGVATTFSDHATVFLYGTSWLHPSPGTTPIVFDRRKSLR